MKALAYAKVNLTLEVLGRRADGYHELRSVVQTVSLADELELIEADGISCDSGYEDFASKRRGFSRGRRA